MKTTLKYSIILLFALTSCLAHAQDSTTLFLPKTVSEIENDTIKQEVLCILNDNIGGCIDKYRSIWISKDGLDIGASIEKFFDIGLYSIDVVLSKGEKGRLSKRRKNIYSTPDDSVFLKSLNYIVFGKPSIEISPPTLSYINTKYVSSMSTEKCSYTARAYRSKNKNRRGYYIHLKMKNDTRETSLVFLIKYRSWIGDTIDNYVVNERVID